MLTAPRTIADTAGICFTKAMNRPLTGGTVEAATKPWLIKSAPPAIPFDTPVPGMPRTSAADNAREAMTTIMIMIMTMTMKQRTKVNDEDTDNDDDGNNNEK